MIRSISYDFDGWLWVRTEEGELCGPYADHDELAEDFPGQS